VVEEVASVDSQPPLEVLDLEAPQQLPHEISPSFRDQEARPSCQCMDSPSAAVFGIGRLAYAVSDDTE
jgi:hypothetical protein